MMAKAWRSILLLATLGKVLESVVAERRNRSALLGEVDGS